MAVPNLEGNSTPLLEAGASSAMPASSATGGPAAASPAQQQALLQLLQGVQRSGGAGGPLTTAQTQIPQARPQPQVGPVATPQIPQGSFQTRGEAGRANTQSVMNSLANLTNMGTKYIQEKRTRENEMMFTRMIGAQEGLTQAQNTLKQDPNNADAKTQLQKNQQILSDILSDPKNVKKAEKAFGVKLIGDDKGRASPEYQGLMQSIKNKDKAGQQAAGGAMANKFQGQFPSTQQMSPQMQAQAAMIKMGLRPTVGEELKAQVEMVKTIQTANDKMWDRESRERITQMLVKERSKEKQSDIIKATMQIAGRNETAKLLAGSQIKRAQIMANAQMEDTKWRMAGSIIKGDLNNKESAAMYKQYNMLDKQGKELTKKLDGLSDTWEDMKGMMGSLNQTKELTNQLRAVEQQKIAIINRTNKSLGVSDGGDSTNTGAGGTGTGQGSSGEDEGSKWTDKFFENAINEPAEPAPQQ